MPEERAGMEGGSCALCIMVVRALSGRRPSPRRGADKQCIAGQGAGWRYERAAPQPSGPPGSPVCCTPERV